MVATRPGPIEERWKKLRFQESPRDRSISGRKYDLLGKEMWGQSVSSSSSSSDSQGSGQSCSPYGVPVRMAMVMTLFPSLLRCNISVCGSAPVLSGDSPSLWPPTDPTSGPTDPVGLDAIVLGGGGGTDSSPSSNCRFSLDLAARCVTDAPH